MKDKIEVQFNWFPHFFMAIFSLLGVFIFLDTLTTSNSFELEFGLLFLILAYPLFAGLVGNYRWTLTEKGIYYNLHRHFLGIRYYTKPEEFFPWENIRSVSWGNWWDSYYGYHGNYGFKVYGYPNNNNSRQPPILGIHFGHTNHKSAIQYCLDNVTDDCVILPKDKKALEKRGYQVRRCLDLPENFEV